MDSKRYIVVKQVDNPKGFLYRKKWIIKAGVDPHGGNYITDFICNVKFTSKERH